MMISATAFFDVTLLQPLIANYGYAAVFVVVMLESTGFPVPGETVLICASIYAGSQYGLNRRYHSRGSLRRDLGR